MIKVRDFLLTTSLMVCFVSQTPKLFAENYYVKAECPPETIKINIDIIGQVPKNYLPEKPYNQGESGTCSLHASTLLLNAVFQQYQENLHGSEYSKHRKELSPVDTALSYCNCNFKDHTSKMFDSKNFVSTILRIRSDKKLGLAPIQGMTLCDVETLNQLSKLFKDNCLQGKCQRQNENIDHHLCLKENLHAVMISPEAKKLIDLSQFLDSELDYAKVAKSKYNFSKHYFKKRPFTKVELPPFNIETRDIFSSKEDIASEIESYFQKSGPLLPLGLNTLFEDDNEVSGHSVVATGLEDVSCLDDQGRIIKKFKQVWFENSWGGKGNGPFDLDKLTEGMFKFTPGIYSLIPCGAYTQRECDSLPILENNKKSLPLLHYAEAGDLDNTQRQINLGNVNPNIIVGASSLYFAAQSGKLEIVQELLKHENVDPNVGSIMGHTPLFVAAKMNHPEIVKELLKNKKIKPNMSSSAGETPLMIASQEGNLPVVELLLNNENTNPHLQSKKGVSAIYLAAQNGHLKIVQQLLKKNVDPENVDDLGETPFYAAVKYGHVAVMRELLQTGKVNADHITKDKFTPLYLASQIGHLDAVTELLKNKKVNRNHLIEFGSTPLFQASFQGHTDIVRVLLKDDEVDPNIVASNGTTALTQAAFAGHEEIVHELLNSKKVGPHMSGSMKFSPIYQATFNGHLGIVKILLAAGAQVDQVELVYKNSPLIVAVFKKYKEIIKVLLDAGANENLENDNQLTPYLLAKKLGDESILEIFREKRPYSL